MTDNERASWLELVASQGAQVQSPRQAQTLVGKAPRHQQRNLMQGGFPASYQERNMNRSESINELAAALSKAQGEIEGAVKDKNNPAFRSKYADLGAVWDAVRGPLAKNGLSIIQSPSRTETGVEVETTLMHSSGQWMSSSLAIPAFKQDAHGIGSATTYARRFALSAFCGVAPVDDDGNAATGRVEGVAGHATAGLRQAAEEITAQTGETRSTYQIKKDAKAAEKPKMSPKEWADGAIQTLNSIASLPEVNVWWKLNEAALTALQEKAEDQYERVALCADDARASLRAHL